MCLAIPGQIQSIEQETGLAVVDVMGVRRKVNIDLIRDEDPGEGVWVLIHVGFAMSTISAEHAEEQLRVLAALGEDDDAKEEAEGYGLGSPAGERNGNHTDGPTP